MDDEYQGYMNDEKFKPKRSRLLIDVDAIVQKGNDVYRIIQVLDFNSVIGVDLVSGRTANLRVGELRAVEDDSASLHVELEEIGDKDWQVAQKRYAAISPLVGKLTIGREDAELRAEEIGVNVATLYRWLKKFNATGSVISLIPRKRGWKSGNRRISLDTEALITDVIDNFYLTPQRPTSKQAVTEILRRCNEKGIEPPSHTTIRARIAEIPERDRLRARGYREKAINRFTPAPGSFPNADYPLSVIQIDHTPADIILVDDIHRLPVGRPWITLAIDVFSRAVTGFYLSFDPPSETSVAMCVASSILPKEEWLITHNIDVEWPVWGIPRTIHVDNGADFRSNSFQKSCLAYGINLEFRPVRQPRYGGHIERLLGTLLREIHVLPGSTFSSIKEREGYDSDKKSAMTRSEFEVWLMTMISKVYHQKVHSRIGMTPLKKWELGIFGDSVTPGVGLPARPADRLSVLLDFLPSFFRTVQTFGVMVDNLTYYAEALRPWINAIDSDNGNKRKLLFRRDPRDISSLWFFDPDIKQYFKIPFADQALPSMSIWEYKQARERLKKQGAGDVNEHEILRAITELRAHVDQAEKKTKKARRQAQRRREHERPVAQVLPSVKKSTLQTTSGGKKELDNDQLVDGDIDTFGDIS
ncbi:DDE-type integrase/transposase/recombinase [Microbulbifer sp. OS29]|uniref:DDE-type integrase/transposase/recombinase n=1 Tax=Microbulbifer okhotskensis TaxID=2926617 RepID=A0A9X2EMR7_9GAMM|nr:DDE-type integrase/transposase/recombinase [Microbulbifer okhotskensis]MCO1334539.1 DDE-type integrase/transposase/recombinase [Microbulbifer okhotskensis]